MPNAADREQVQRDRDRDKQAARDKRTLWARQLSTPEGRQFAWMLLGEFGIYRHIGGAVEHVYGQAALHNKGCDIFREISERFPEQYLQMEHEALERGRDDRRLRMNPRTTAPE